LSVRCKTAKKMCWTNQMLFSQFVRFRNGSRLQQKEFQVFFWEHSAGFEPATIRTPARRIANSATSALYHWRIIGNISQILQYLGCVFLWFLFFSLAFFFPLHFINIGLMSALLYIYFLFLFNLKRGVFIHNPFIVFIAWVG